MTEVRRSLGEVGIAPEKACFFEQFKKENYTCERGTVAFWDQL